MGRRRSYVARTYDCHFLTHDFLSMKSLKPLPQGHRVTHGRAIPDIGARSNTKPAYLRGAGIGNVVTVQVGTREHRILVRPGHYLLEDRVRDAVVDHDFFLPCAVPVTLVNAIEHFLHLLLY